MIFRGTLIELDNDGRGWVRIPALTGSSPVGPLQVVPAGLAPGEGILIGAIRGRTEDLLVLSREAEPDTAAPVWGDIVDKPATFAPAAHTHTLDAGTGRLRFDQLPAFPEIPNAVDLNDYITDGTFHQSQNADTTAGVNYPTPAAGLLEVKVSGGFVYQRYTVYNSGKEYTRSKYSTIWYGWREVPSRAEMNTLLNAKAASVHTHLWADLTDRPATFAPSAHTHPAAEVTGVLSPGQLPAATSAAAGSLSAADKAKLDGASATTTGSSLALRSAAGHVSANVFLGDAAQSASANAMTRRDYVDAQIATRATSGHVHDYSQITGTVPTSALPPLAVINTTPVASEAAQLALVAQRGDIAIRTDIAKTYVLASDSPGTLADWKEMLAAGQVTAVAGKTGVVSLVKADVGLGSVDNTSDLAKPVSTATASALAGKSDTSHTHAAATGSAAGLMSAADKTKLDAATAAATGSTLALRSSGGAIAVTTGASATDAASKGYVDGLVLSRRAEFTAASNQAGPGSGGYFGLLTADANVNKTKNNNFCTPNATGPSYGLTVSVSGEYSLKALLSPTNSPGNVTLSLFVNGVRIDSTSGGTYGDWEKSVGHPCIWINAGEKVEVIQANSGGVPYTGRVWIKKIG